MQIVGEEPFSCSLGSTPKLQKSMLSLSCHSNSFSLECNKSKLPLTAYFKTN